MVATVSILADMVRQVGGPLVRVRSLVPVDGDAHSYEPRPSDMMAVRAAAVVVTNGLGLEKWFDRLLQSAGGAPRVVVASAGVTPRQMADAEQGGAVVTDPHAWQNPRTGEIYARNIADALAQIEIQGARYPAALASRGGK